MRSVGVLYQSSSRSSVTWCSCTLFLGSCSAQMDSVRMPVAMRVSICRARFFVEDVYSSFLRSSSYVLWGFFCGGITG